MALKTIGSTVVEFDALDSTNNYVAKALEAASYEPGSVILAHMQTEGRGRQGSTWQAEPAKNLTFSFALELDFLSLHKRFLLSKAVSVAVIEALEAVLGQEVYVKWPNDLILNQKKVCGMLIETRGSRAVHAIVGIGINVNQLKFAPELKATSLALETGMAINRRKLLDDICRQLQAQIELLRNGHHEAINASYAARLYRRNEWTQVQCGHRNYQLMVKDVDDQGMLITHSRQGHTELFRAGELKITY